MSSNDRISLRAAYVYQTGLTLKDNFLRNADSLAFTGNYQHHGVNLEIGFEGFKALKDRAVTASLLIGYTNAQFKGTVDVSNLMPITFLDPWGAMLRGLPDVDVESEFHKVSLGMVFYWPWLQDGWWEFLTPTLGFCAYYARSKQLNFEQVDDDTMQITKIAGNEWGGTLLTGLKLLKFDFSKFGAPVGLDLKANVGVDVGNIENFVGGFEVGFYVFFDVGKDEPPEPLELPKPNVPKEIYGVPESNKFRGVLLQ